MDFLKHILLGLAGTLAIGWTAVFVVVFLDRLRGRGVPPSFFRGGRYHLPKNLRSLSWHQHLIRLPLYCVGIPAFALCCLIILPPLYVIDLGGKFRAKCSGRISP